MLTDEWLDAGVIPRDRTNWYIVCSISIPPVHMWSETAAYLSHLLADAGILAQTLGVKLLVFELLFSARAEGRWKVVNLQK
jgi:hypothetical protein